MQRSSESIGAIAAALAKAQTELTNPEKSLIAIIRASNQRESDQTFRYAALAGGLDIVRKTLGAHEIAAVQSTAIDKDAGLIRLTTTLAHSSGEWLSSEWPVCPVSETALPRRMGAALTYARRYALFTLVGIAGEDDLDAPDLNADHKPHSIPAAAQIAVDTGPAAVAEERQRAKVARRAKVTLPAAESAAERARMIAEIERLQSSDEAADWVHRNLPAKNTLTPGDGDVVEATFRDRLAAIEERADSHSPEPDGNDSDESASWRSPALDALEPLAPATADRRQRKVASKTIRIRDKDHCTFVAKQPCVVCGRTPAESHHLRFAQPRAIGQKVSDEFTVPLCRLHHRELHRYGDEASWWAGVNVDPLPIALDLWRRSR
jgi:hypothetical protein